MKKKAHIIQVSVANVEHFSPFVPRKSVLQLRTMGYTGPGVGAGGHL